MKSVKSESKEKGHKNRDVEREREIFTAKDRKKGEKNQPRKRIRRTCMEL
jgi:hypothetical protein